MATTWNPNIRDCASAWLNPKTKAKALARAKERSVHKKAWLNLANAMEANDVARVTARATGDWSAIEAERKARVSAKPKATAKAKATPKAKAVAPVTAEGNGMVEAMANIVGQMDADVQMAFLNLVAKGIAKK